MDRADAPDAGPARRHPRARRSWSGFALLSVAVAALFPIPVASILFSLTQSGSGTWTHLASTVLPMYHFNTAVLVAGVGIGVPVIGAGTAWLVRLEEHTSELQSLMRILYAVFFLINKIYQSHTRAATQ